MQPYTKTTVVIVLTLMVCEKNMYVLLGSNKLSLAGRLTPKITSAALISGVTTAPAC